LIVGDILEIDQQAIDEVRVIGRVISGKTFSGKEQKLDIPEIYSVQNPSIKKAKKCLLESMQDLDDIALLLSGGKDSRMLGVLLKELGKDVTCYTYIGRHNKYEENELKVSKIVAKKLGFRHSVIDIDWESKEDNGFYDRKMIPEIVKKTDGSPIFQTVLTMSYARPKIQEKILITGDLVTELLDTGEYRPWYHGKDIKRFLFDCEKCIIDTVDDLESYNRLSDMYESTDVNNLLIVRKSDRINRKSVYKDLGWNVFFPALDVDVLSNVFSLPYKFRTDGNLPRMIVKMTNKELYKTRTTRSPFSLKYPLSFHIAYGRVFKTGVNNTPIIGSFNDDIRIIENKHKRERLDNLQWWKFANGVKDEKN